MADWINISQSSGSGNATITVTASSYSQLLERSAALTIKTASKSAILGLIQKYNTGFDVTPTDLINIPASGGEYTITVISDDTWHLNGEVGVYDVFSASQNSGGTGTTTVTITISANTGTSRNTYIRITQGTVFDTGKPYREIPIVQNGAGDDNNFYISPHSGSFSPEAQTSQFRVYSNASWTITTNDPFITVYPNSGTGDTNITVSVSQNDGADRTGSINGYVNGSFKDQVVIAQSGYNQS